MELYPGMSLSNWSYNPIVEYSPLLSFGKDFMINISQKKELNEVVLSYRLKHKGREAETQRESDL